MNIPTSLLRKLLLGLIAGMVGASLALLLFLPGWLDVWEVKTWDWRVNAMAKPVKTSDPIRLILLDQNSLDWAKEENGLAWPWPREVYNAIIHFCQRSGAKALAEARIRLAEMKSHSGSQLISEPGPEGAP